MVDSPSSKGSGLLRIAWWLAAGVALAAQLLTPKIQDAFDGSRLVPSPSVLALLLGMVAGGIPGVRARFAPAMKAVSKQAIPIAIVALGFGLDLKPLLDPKLLGVSLGLVVVGMAVAFGASMFFGKLFGLDPRASMLLGAGTAVCGNSAIMAVAPTVDAKDEDLGLVVGVINLLGVLMILVLPPAVSSFGITNEQGAALAGLTVHAVPQAIATGEAFGINGAADATLYKLLRVAMLAPVVLLLAFVLGRLRGANDVQAKKAGLPWFVLLFVVAAAIRAFGLLDWKPALGSGDLEAWEYLKKAGKFLLAIALAAIGVGLDVKTLIRVGPRVLLAGACAVTAMVAALFPLVRWLL